MHELRDSAVAEYHQLLASDGSLSGAALDRFNEAMRRNHLVYGDRPIGIALRPHFLERSQFQLLAHRAQLIEGALEKVAAAAVENPTLMHELGLTDRERRLALVESGLCCAGLTTRLDGFVQGDDIQFIECNAENPSSLSDQEGLNRLLFEFPAMSLFAQRYHLQQFSPVEALFKMLIAVYHDWGGKRLPNVAILDWENLPTASEFVLLEHHFGSHGMRTIICAPDDLEYERGKLRCRDFQIDVVYKRILIHEFLDRYDDTHPLVQAYVNHDVCMVNPFRCKIMHKKATFQFLTDEAYQSWFTREEREAVNASVPWTRRLSDRNTAYRGRKIALLDLVSKNRADFVLKANDDYGGRSVCLGSVIDRAAWDNAIETALSSDYIVQEAVDIPTEEFPILHDREWKLERMFVDTNPFLFCGEVCGALVRLSHSPIVNVTSGGGETGFFVIDPG